ncbi:SIMPL domain-containing protein [Pedobacter sp. P351]|uniref:SIMPL domain-containing protein n=1 Tax=Pedobacter superstes TaxID=3133441 RepID=UPI003096A6E1
MTRTSLFIVSFIVVCGAIFSAWLIGRALERFKKEDRYISVKGFAEREVKADMVIWSLKVGLGSNDLRAGSAAMEIAKNQVIGFLLKNGINSSEITEKDLNVQDRQANAYEAPNANYTFRYIIRETIEVRSQKVDLVQRVSRKTGDLLTAGVVLSTDEWSGSGLKFIFSKLNEIKPKMLTEAINNARNAAVQFTRESNTQLGSLRKASQGLFSIQDRDDFLSSQNESGHAYPPGKSDIYKTVRVVISVDYTVE